ncbi:DNA methyltransferase [Desulfuromonas sp. TF]|uniref:Eco57I restriction-modification methylase domain-containing protein n=1 Tax=Desulfuromonas sp. TF TaxID=1232410 RepID=UPI00040D7C93|nr:DNA methyltransferase [Desulfuromonas sp. TF]
MGEVIKIGQLDIQRTRDLLQRFDFPTLFIEELGWSQPASRQPITLNVDGASFTARQIAQLSGVVVFEIAAADGRMPQAKTRAALHKEIARHHHENLLIFVDQERTNSLWYWVKREGNKNFPREHLYIKGQPGDLFLSKLGAMVVDISELDASGALPVTEVASRLKKALDVERVTKKFYREFQEQHLAFIDLIEGIADDRQRRWYASILLNRLMFIYFLQKKGFVDHGNLDYLQARLAHSRQVFGPDRYYRAFLWPLFFEGFAKPEQERSPEIRQLLGNIKYLNGGLFLPHAVELKNPDIRISDKAFANLLGLFERYSWNLNDTPAGKDDEINPDVLGYIFEKYINQKAFGAYYTRPEITEYLCERTIYKLVLDKINSPGVPGVLAAREYDSMAELLLDLDAELCRELLHRVLPELSLLDPACGSGAFLVAAMKTLINLYAAIIGKIEFLNDRNLTEWLRKEKASHKSINYFIKKRIITDNLYGVDIMEEATEIAKLRLFLALVAAAQSIDELEPLPNIDFNILAGNSLIGLLHVDPAKFDTLTAGTGSKPGAKSAEPMVAEPGGFDFGTTSAASRKDLQRELLNQRTAEKFTRLLEEKNRLIDTFRHTAGYVEDLRAMRDAIDGKKREALVTLNKLLLDEFVALDIKFEEATWDPAKNKVGKPKKRALTIADIEALHPFHWGYEFDEILNRRGGFDAIITNPPWEIFKPQAKEFLAEHSDLVTKNKMTIKEFEKEQAKLMKDADILAAWIEYQSRFPHVSLYYRGSRQYKNQISIVNGKKAGSDINLYKLFTEQCFNLLRPGGECGIVIPSGIYTDLGTKQLREMLFAETGITGLFCFENRKEIFEGVDSRFKFVVLTFVKGGGTVSFPTAFMRHEVAELERFPKGGALEISVALIKRLSPESLGIIEFESENDLAIARKSGSFPLLGVHLEKAWNVSLQSEFHMTNDSYLFHAEFEKGMMPLYEGKNIHQYNHEFEKPRYWVWEKEARKAVLGRSADIGQRLDYQDYRLGCRKIARNTDERTLISTIIPPNFHAENFQSVHSFSNGSKRFLSHKNMLYLCAVWNSFTLDYQLRLRVTANVNFFYIYQLPVPRLTEKDPAFRPIVERAAHLICTTPEFDDLAREAGIGSHKQGVTDPVERARLRAELDGLVAHLYGLTEAEFAYILTTFPLVKDPVKIAAQNAYRDVERGLIQ